MDVLNAPKQIWFFSDPHFNHASLVHGSMKHATPGRPEFVSVEQMNECILDNCNAVIRPNDHWYCMGDVAMHREGVKFLERINGHGRLILGNHDLEKVEFYRQYVKKIYAMREFDGMMFTHIPIAPWSMRWRTNVHGHCHLAKPLFYSVSDPEMVGFGKKVAYVNLSMEHTKYRPVPLDEISKWSRDARTI